jgi:hypothetical protein
MRRRIAILAAVLAAVAALVADASAQQSLTIRLVSVTTSHKTTDRPPAGPSTGDRYFSTSRLANAVAQFARRRGAVVGNDRGAIVLTSATSARIDVVTTLPGGKIFVRGELDVGPGSIVAPVTGGTGKYEGVRGTLTIVEQTRTQALNVYRLRFAPIA